MAHPKVTDEKLIGALSDVFRTHGYEGASLSRLSAATGLEKASLYHRFPGGKDDMVAAVVAHLNQWFQDKVFTPLEQPGDPAGRIRFVAERLREFYGDGTKPCALNTLSLPGGSAALHEALRGALTAWLQAFMGIAREAGVPLERIAGTGSIDAPVVVKPDAVSKKASETPGISPVSR